MNSRLSYDPDRQGRWTLVLAFALLATAVSVTSPLFESSDEIRHYRYIRILATERRLPVQGQEPARAQSHHPPLYYALSAALSVWVPSAHDGTYQHLQNPFWGYRSFAPGADNKLQYWHSPAEPFRQGYLAALVPRWVNIMLGAATVVVTEALGRRVFGGPTRPESQPGSAINPTASSLALAAASVIALNPQFIYLSAAINNDIVASLTGVSMLLACVTLVQDGLRWPNTIILGGVSGLGLLSKLQIAFLGPVVTLAIFLAAWRARERTPWLPNAVRALTVAALVVAFVSGWWYVRNVQLYGEPTGMGVQREMWGGRDAANNLWAIGQGLPQLWASLWGQFGYGQTPLPGWMTTTMLLGCLICLAGHLRWRHRLLGRETAALLLVAIALMTMAVAYYMAANPAGAMGRFLFPVLPAFAILLVAGLEKWLHRAAWTRAVTMGLMALFAAVALFGFLWPAVTYPQRRILQPVGNEPAAQVGDVAEIWAVSVDQEEVMPGSPVYIRVNWQPLRWTEEPLTVFVHLIDEAGIVVAQRDTWPGLSRAPTTSWRADVPFVDTYRVDLPATLYAPNSLTVHIGLYGNTVGRLPIAVGDAPPTDSWAVGALQVAAPEGAWPNPIDANFEDQLHLVGYEITPRLLGPGETFTLTTVWRVPRALETTPHLFAQVLDAEWHVWGSRDGGHPEWMTGIVTDSRQITVVPETPPGSYPVNVGLVSEGGRLDVLGPDDRPVGDFVSLGPIGVR
ncbi:MAG: DUF2142 domain-containing protein [Anaerolineae bacterium]|nr:DUF2142 domain-containing protein [Anaerolineae bacterium]